LVNWLAEPDYSDSQIVLQNGPVLCGQVVGADSGTLVVSLQATGTLRTFHLGDVRALRHKAC
jgi:hypothetical protein